MAVYATRSGNPPKPLWGAPEEELHDLRPKALEMKAMTAQLLEVVAHR